MLSLDSDARFLRFIKYGPSAIVLLVAVLFAYFAHTEHKTMLAHEIARTTESYTTINKAYIKDKVDHIIERLAQEQNSLESRLQELSQNDVRRIAQSARQDIDRNRQASLADLKAHALSTLRHPYLHTESCEYMVMDEAGIGILHNKHPDFAGENLLNKTDSKGKPFYGQVLRHLRHHEDIYTDWTLPGTRTQPHEKHIIGYFTRLRRLNWIIGVGSSVENYKKRIKAAMLKEIGSIRFGKHGYVFVVDQDNTFLTHIHPDHIGKTINETQAIEDPAKTWNEALPVAYNSGGFFTATHNQKPISDVPARKVYYSRAFAPWGWVVATGFYLDDIKEALRPRIAFLNQRYKVYIHNIWIYGTLITAIVLLASFSLSRHLEWTFTDYRDKLKHLSNSDKLTGLNNRMMLDTALDYEIKKYLRYGENLSLIMLDIDHFKEVNDTYGHQVGDRVLIAIGKVLQTSKRETDIIGRWGGEEFLIICPHTDGHDAVYVAERYRAAIANTEITHVGSLTASFGVSSFVPTDNAMTAIKRVDDALYQAKAHGRDQVVYALFQP